MYQQFKQNVLGKVIGDGQCVSLVVNNSNAYIEALYPGVNWTTIIAPVEGAKDMAGKGNQYLQWIENDHNDPNQVPEQGDIMIFGATPAAGYSNTFANPYGHTGICDSTDANGYVLLQQNSPSAGAAVNLKAYPWKFRPCLGWYHPLTPGVAPIPTPSPVAQPHTIYLPPTTGPWHLYNVGGPYSPAHAKGVLVPSQFGGLTYPIVNARGNGIYTINSHDFGTGDLWTKGSDVVIK